MRAQGRLLLNEYESSAWEYAPAEEALASSSSWSLTYVGTRQHTPAREAGVHSCTMGTSRSPSVICNFL